MLDKLKSYVSIVILFQHKAVLFIENDNKKDLEKIKIVDYSEIKDNMEAKTH